MSYVVFARKWRPKNFDEIVGQEHITTTLKNAISNNRVAHAYIFTGPRGIGKTSAARILAKGLNCEKGSTPRPCGKCASCNSISSGTSMDVIEIDGASNNSVDQVRELRENIKFSPAYGRYKVYIIDEVHMLSIGAFNALLKTLEEPPKHAKFIFATTNPEKVPPTILSRCQRFDFGRIPLKLIIAKLFKITEAEKLNVSEEALFSIARAADGSMRDAESVLDQLTSFCENKIDQKDVIDLLGAIEEDKLAAVVKGLSEKDTTTLLEMINEMINAGKDISQFLIGLMGYIRNLMVLKVNSGLKSLIDLPDKYINDLNKQMNKFQLEDLLYIFYTLSTTANAVRRSDIARFILEVAFIKLSLRSELMSLSEIMDKISHLESRMNRRDYFPQETKVNIKPEPQLDTKTENSTPEFSIPEKLEIERGESTEIESEGTSVLTIEKIKKAWPRILQIIKGKKISIASYLLEGDIIEVKDALLTLGFAKKFNFHKEVLEHADNRKFVEDVISDAVGQKAHIEFVTLEKSEAPPAIPDDSSEETEIAGNELEREAKKDIFNEPIIQTAIEMFNGKIVRNEKERYRK